MYAPFVSTPVTFEEEVPSREAYRKRIESICEKYPCLVAEEGGRIVGFAYAHELRERIAFQWNAELSVYLAPAAQGVAWEARCTPRSSSFCALRA